jgi:hypothetical protein
MTRVMAVKAFFEKDTVKPLSNTEFMAFWKACSEEERKDYGDQASKELGITVE